MILLRHDRETTLEEVLRVAQGEVVEVYPATLALLDERRRHVQALIDATQRPAYGFNRGFGSNVDQPVDADRLKELQYNLLRSHASGVGPAVSREVVRATMFLRARSLAFGHSGIRGKLVERLLDLLNADVVPVVPAYGSVGASGDLAPLSHVALALIGEGEVTVGNGPVEPAAGALARLGLEPLELEMKEGLALNNGVQFSTALGIVALNQLERLLKTAALTTALSGQVLLGSDAPFMEELHRLRPHPGAQTVASWIRQWMKDSPIRHSHEQYDVDGQVQDPYSLRCSAQILGTCHDLLEEARKTFHIEVNSVTDNPLILESSTQPGVFDQIISGGHFHGMPIAVKLYNLVQAMGIMARLSNLRAARYVDSQRNRGLGHDLKWPELSREEDATQSSMMIPEYVSAALTNVIWGAAMPSHLFSISTDAGQEDHVSMSAGLGIRLLETIPRLAEILAIELAYASQAATIRKVQPHFPTKVHLNAADELCTRSQREAYEEAVAALPHPLKFDLRVRTELMYHWTEEERTLSPVCEAVVARVQEVFPTVKKDRFMSAQLQALARLVASGELLVAAGLD